MENPNLKAWLATIGFSLIALWTLLFRSPITPELLPQAILYTVLLINTFFSIRFYSAIQPAHMSQTLIDAALVVTYIALALSLGRPLAFATAALFLFIAAPVKYSLMLDKIPYTALLKKKIFIDSSGTVGCILLLAITLAGYPFLAVWSFAIIFTLANIYLLSIRPMYRL